jgi:hypothetical protein
MLVGLRCPQPRLFEDIDWGSERVMAQTRLRLSALGLRWRELPSLWDLDRPEDSGASGDAAGVRRMAAMNRQRRRASLTLLALPAIGATGVMRGFAVAAASDGDGPRRIELPRFSAAPPGQRLPAGWTHQTLPSVERPNRFDLVADEGVTVLRVLSDHSASSLAVGAARRSGGDAVAQVALASVASASPLRICGARPAMTTPAVSMCSSICRPNGCVWPTD